jgi:uridylate kinase
MKKEIVLKVGGSILYDHLLNINFDFFKKIKDWYWSVKDSYSHIVLVSGGGGLSREMEAKVSEYIKEKHYIHEIGMSITQTNAIILASYIGDDDIFVPETLGDAYEFLNSEKEGFMVSGGLKVGWSTDMDAAVFSDVLHTQRVYKISNVDFIYDKDPKEFFDARPIRDMKWEEYFNMFSVSPEKEHIPNAHIPVDAKCAVFCEKKNINFHVTGGKLLHEIDDIKGILNEGTFLHN